MIRLMSKEAMVFVRRAVHMIQVEMTRVLLTVAHTDRAGPLGWTGLRWMSPRQRCWAFPCVQGLRCLQMTARQADFDVASGVLVLVTTSLTDQNLNWNEIGRMRLGNLLE